MEHPLLLSHMLVADLLTYSPLIAPLLFELRVDCLGCSMKKFCSLEELSRQYKMDLETLIAIIQERVNYNASY